MLVRKDLPFAGISCAFDWVGIDSSEHLLLEHLQITALSLCFKVVSMQDKAFNFDQVDRFTSIALDKGRSVLASFILLVRIIARQDAFIISSVTL